MALRTRNVVSLCAGVGGLELGIALALRLRGEDACGICYVEREAAAAASLVASMEGGWLHPAPVWSDLLTFDARPWRGLVHILASGDPCQDNSVAGKKAGADGERFLAPEVVRIADECGPDLIFRENVPGNAAGQLEAIVPALERLGFCVAAGIFSSAETGNTMRRERLFIMAQRQDRQRGLGARSERPCLADAAGGSGELVKPEGVRSGEGGTEHARQQGRCAAPRTGGAVGSAEGVAGGGEQQSGSARSGRTGLAGDGAELGGARGAEPQGQQRGQHLPSGREIKGGHSALSGRTILPPAVIPGPSDSGWRDILDRWPELQPALSQEEAQSHLRRGVDAMANRVERLRATGNGVDPVVAAYAFLSLGALLTASAAAGVTVLNP